MQFPGSRWWTALALVALVAAAVLCAGLGSFGLWEPQERALADRAARVEPPKQAPPRGECPKQAPDDAVARTLQGRAIAFGRELGDGDTAARLPFALLGLLTVLATAGIAMRLGRPRAGLLAGLVMLAMPLLVLQSRQLMSEIGTAAGGALAVYGLVALSAMDDPVRAARRSPVLAIADGLVGSLALAGGVELGYLSGGALLGVVAPVGAFALTGAFGIPVLADGVRLVRNKVLAGIARFKPRWTIGHRLARYRGRGTAPALLATVIAGIALAAIIYQIFALREPQPGLVPPERAVLGHAIVAPGCWSPALGGIWRADDDLRFVYDSAFEQIVYGTFPWGLLAPIAFASLIAAGGKAGRLGALTLAWAGATWIATELFQRKVGFALYAGFPALAAALGGWLDELIDPHSHDAGARKLRPRGALLVGIFTVLAVGDVAKDLEAFTDKLSSLLVGGESIAYPAASRLLFAPTRLWLLALGTAFAFAFALALAFADSPVAARRRFARWCAAATFAVTLAFALFWSFGWQRALGSDLSSKDLLGAVQHLAKQGDQLLIMGDLGGAPADYAPDLTPEKAAGRAQIVSALGRANRVFAIAPQSELCPLHREMGEKPYFVLDDRNTRSLLLTNQLGTSTDVNPLREMILHAPPAKIPERPRSRIVWENKIELLGWSVPKSADRGGTFEITLYYKVLGNVGGAWTVLMHFDGAFGRAFNGDHAPIDGRCATSTWQAGDYIVDRHVVDAGNATTPPGKLDVWTGFFTGSTGNYKNMPISQSPPELRDPQPTDRIKIATIVLD